MDPNFHALQLIAEIALGILGFSAILIGLWSYFGKHKGILLLQIFYASAGIIGMIRWFG